MKKKFIFVLFITLVGSLSLMAQTKKKAKTRKKTTTHKKVTQTAKVDTSSYARLPANNKIDTLKTVKDSDDGYLKSDIMLKARPFVLKEPNQNYIQMYHEYKRDIDLKDPKNAKFNTPGSTLIETLLKGIKDGAIIPYDATPTTINPSGDKFTSPLTYNQLMSKLTDTAMVDRLDKDGNKIGSVKQLNDFSPNKVVGYRIKEDVYYDRHAGKVETRIIGLAPLATLKLSNGDTIGIQPVCWLRFKQCRFVFAKMDVSDPERNLYDVSMDDMFLQRQFNAKIVEESNPQGIRIKDYMKDKASQDKEAIRIEQKLADWKKSLFSYELSTPSVASVSKTSKPSKKQKSSRSTPATAAAPLDNTPPATGTPVKQ